MARRAKRRTGGDSYEDVKYQINVREGNRLAPVLRDLIGTEDPEDLALDILDVLTEGSKVPQVGNYYVFIYNPKTPNIQYDQHPLVAVVGVFEWGFRGLNYHWGEVRNYTWNEVAGGLYMVSDLELRSLRTIPFARFRLNS
tara:strand:+ start:449 stop:871 length:423 start_codon:yes stop_codon:yes gene_type:complete